MKQDPATARTCGRPFSSVILPPSSFSLLIALLALVAAGKAVLYDTLDPDCFWHLRVAEQLTREGIGPMVDDLSFASIKTPWTPYSWLAELGMKAIWDAGGFQLAVAVQAMMMAGFVVFVALSARETTRDGNPLAVILATLVGMFLALPYLSFRPVTFAILLLACCTWLPLRDRRMEERSRAVWLVVPITVLITNCHFFAILVPMCVAALLIGAIWEKRNIPRYAVMFGLTLVACCLTPMLPGAIESIWHYQFADPMVSGGVIAEFQPLWKSPIGMTLILCWLGMCISRRDRFRFGEWLWMAGCLVLVMRLGRFAPVVAPLLAATFAAAMPRFSDRAMASRPIRVAVSCILLIGLIRITLALPGSLTNLDDWLNRHGPDTPGYPTAATAFVQANVRPGRIINEFTWGGFIAWRLGDDYQVLLDGRTQMYTPGFWRSTYLGEPHDSKPILAQSHASAAILPAQRSRFRTTLLNLGWKTVYLDDRAQVLLPPESNASINP